MGRLVCLGFFVLASIGACSTFSEEASAPPGGDAGVADAGPLADAVVPPTDAAVVGPECVPDDSDGGVKNFAPQGRDALLDPTSKTGGSGGETCDLSVHTCLVAFDLGADATRQIHSAQLTLRRAIGKICDGATDCELRQENGTVLVRHMRADWTEAATHALIGNASAMWGLAGAEGPDDVAPTGSQVVARISEPANVTLPRALLDPRFLPTVANPLLAFRLTPASSFQFVIHRIKNAPPQTPDLASLQVHFCKTE